MTPNWPNAGSNGERPVSHERLSAEQHRTTMQTKTATSSTVPIDQVPDVHHHERPLREAESDITKILAGKVFDPYSRQLLDKRLITVSSSSGLILDVQAVDSWSRVTDATLQGARVVDLRDHTVLPGFVDAHVHLFLHPYNETSWEDQTTRESLAERTIRATAHARRTLMAGYTAIRDLGTEGAQDADLALRKCLSGPNPVIPGPRYFIANRAIVTTGSYGPKNRLYPHQNGVEDIMGAEVADGEVECRKAVRRQVGAGADWIKIYADYRARACMSDVDPRTAGRSYQTFGKEELQTLVTEAHKLGAKVAAHASTATAWTVLRDLSPPVDTIEHSYEIGELFEKDYPVSDNPDEHLPVRSKGKPTWVPTLATYYTVGQRNGMWERAAKSFKAVLSRAPQEDLAIACGGDTGVFAHGDNALEMKVMVRLGADWRQVLRWATLGGWECIRSMRWEGKEGEERLRRVEELGEDIRVVGDNEAPFGAITKGFAADIIATNGDLERDFEVAVDRSSISFVMKGGRVYKSGGREMV